MTGKLFRNGGSLGLTVPKDLAERYHLQPGVEVEITPRDDGILLTPLGVAPWFSVEWERALDGMLERYRDALELIHEAQ
jgi:antitoxin component of MazEF toxin-antitoxin module